MVIIKEFISKLDLFIIIIIIIIIIVDIMVNEQNLLVIIIAFIRRELYFYIRINLMDFCWV